MSPSRALLVKQYVAVAVLGILLFARSWNFWILGPRMDALFFVVVGVALALMLFPLERIRSIKAGGIEFSVNEPAIRGAIASLNLDLVQNRQLRDRLGSLESELHAARGGRVLWIDDRPHKIVGERRLLRALGVDVTPAASSDDAVSVLDRDNDFDLIITDVQREGDSHKLVGGIEIHEGTNLIVWLRTTYKNPLVRALPVIFYAAYDQERLEEFTRRASALTPRPVLSNSVVTLIPAVVSQLATARAAPLQAPGTKEPTLIGNDA
jgi:CheY-like chemotaxis protein